MKTAYKPRIPTPELPLSEYLFKGQKINDYCREDLLKISAILMQKLNDNYTAERISNRAMQQLNQIKNEAKQTHKQSLIEVFVSTLVGYFISLIAQAIVFPLFGYNPTHQENVAIALIFTVISSVRGYILRRVFNCIHSTG